MGVYLVSVATQDWFAREEGGHAEVASALAEELRRRGLPPYRPGAGAREAPGWFEEKVSPSMDGFVALCRARLTDAEVATLLDWSVLVPLSLDEGITLPVGSAYTDETLVAGAPQVLALAERLAAVIGLPLDAIPATGGNLELTLWFLDGEGREAAATHPGPWAEDLDAAFYVALYLRAARYALRYGCAMKYC
ncbi:hypothetical protein OG562_39715 [Streptomyces sp. NBC_01275]|uniref:hypothetical protein n=1 Tax=Streptomyces sp. NBC_01275 TaxID=2903807 RepID=UPI0022564D66|nr:hypothetical protein [Streptomyces sp. NBC_01275]MCX4766990.1 hypothetical protein [Streptomyces sp. NBC_01275]